MKNSIKALIFTVVILFATDALSQTGKSDKALIPEEPDLTRKSAQSVASLFSITIQDYFIASRWNKPGTGNVVEFRSMIPFKVWEQSNLIRVSIPFRTESELGPGLSDVRLFDLLMFENTGIIWGIGPVFNLGINRGPGIDTLQAGPAAAFVITSVSGLSIGLLNQNFFSDQVALSSLQPILLYAPSRIWTIGLGEFPFVYDWNRDIFAVFTIGFQVGVLQQVADQPVRLFISPQFNTKSNTKLYQWTVTSGVTLPLTALPLKGR